MKVIGRRQGSDKDGPGAVIVELGEDEWEAVRALMGPLPFTVTKEAVNAWGDAKAMVAAAAKALGLTVK